MSNVTNLPNHHQHESIADEGLSLRDTIEFIFRIKLWLIIAAISALVGSHYQQSSNLKFMSTSLLTVQKSENSPLQALSQKLSGLGGDTKSTNEFLETVQMHFRSEHLLRTVAVDLMQRPDYPRIKATLGKTGRGLKSKFYAFLGIARPEVIAPMSNAEETQALADTLMAQTGADIIFNDTLKLWIKCNSGETCVTVLNSIVEHGVNAITKDMLQELDRTKLFISEKAVDVQKDIQATQSEIAKLQKDISGLSGGQGTQGNLSMTISKVQDDLSRAESEKLRRVELLQKAQDKFDNTGDYNSVTRIEKLKDEKDYWTASAISLSATLTKLRSSQKTMPDLDQKVLNLGRQLEFQFKFYADLKSQLLNVEMMQISISNKVQVFEPASPTSTFRRSAGTKHSIMAILIAVMLTGLIAYFFDIMYPSVRGKKEVQSYGAQYLGEVPDFGQKKYIQASRRIFGKDYSFQNYIIWKSMLQHKAIDCPETMIFKNLRSKIMHVRSADKSSIQVVCITSPLAAEGKSLIASNLASTLSLVKKRTLVIDCDLRHPKTTGEFGYKENEGLSNYLLSNEANPNWQGSVQKPFDYLHVLPSGAYNHLATEAFGSENFEKLLAEARKRYDYIILDCPPLLSVSDTVSIAKYADFVLLSLVQFRTKLDDAKTCIDELKFNEISQIGFILNKTKGSLKPSQYYYYVSQAS